MNKKCPLCGCENIKLLKHGVRDNSQIDVMMCPNCSLEFLSDFSHVTDKFYEIGEMHKKELASWIENTKPDDKRRFEFLQKKILNKKVLDFGAGNGNFAMFAQADGVEIDESLKNYFKDNNLKIYKTINDVEKKYDVITMFHVLEHLKSPVEMLKNLSKHLENEGQIVIEVPNSSDALLKLYKNKDFADFTYWGCHLFNYNEKTLKMIVEKAGLKVVEVDYIQRYSLMNHLYWLIKKLPTGHRKWAKYDCKFLNFLYKNLLKIFKNTDTIMVIAEKV